MRDGLLRRVVKRLAGGTFSLERGLRRRLTGAIEPYRLAGACRRSGGCCEAPALRVGKAVWYLPTLRWLFLWWQRVVNGFELTGRDPHQRVFVFRCTHFDPTSRLCDSYDSRPGFCRDYPQGLLAQPSPQLLAGCGFRVVARNAEGLRRALAGRGLSREQMDRLAAGLHLDP